MYLFRTFIDVPDRRGVSYLYNVPHRLFIFIKTLEQCFITIKLKNSTFLQIRNQGYCPISSWVQASVSFELSDETKILISAAANLANVTFDRLPSKIKIAVISFPMAVFRHSVTDMKNLHFPATLLAVYDMDYSKLDLLYHFF